MATVMVFLLISGMGISGMVTMAAAEDFTLGDIPLDKETYEKYIKVPPSERLEEVHPSSYDARNDGIVTLAKDQGSCGSCWSFASVGALESHILKKYAVGPYDLSEQQILNCNTYGYSCSGGSSDAPRYWESTGPITEACYPYTATKETCSYSCTEMAYRVTGWHTVTQSEWYFKDSCYNEGPSYWRFQVYSDFADQYGHGFWYDAGPGDVYTNASGTYQGGHAVLLIGWDDTKSAYLCKNSWGATGGPNDDGTFWIAYTGHANDLGFGMSNFDITGTPTAGTPSSITVPSSDSDGSYTVSWGASSTSSVTYVLEEATNSSFSSGLRTAYSGSSTSTTITGRSSGTTYYYRVKATKSGYTDSPWRTGLNGCVVGALSLPLTENFSASTMPSGWTTQNIGTGISERWNVSNSNNAGGSPYEMRCSWQSVNPGTTRLITPAISTVGINQVTLSFKHFLNAFQTGANLWVQTSNDTSNWTNKAWSIATGSSNIGPATVTVTITTNLNSSTTYFAFVVDGNLYQIDYWYIDNVSLTGTVANVETPTFDPNGGMHSGTSVDVTVSCTTSEATIRYTTNGSEPTESSPIVASGGTVFVPVPGTLKAKAWKTGMNPSETKSADYTAATITILYVSKDGNCDSNTPCYTSIQDAINHSPTGSVILVKEGTYPESISLGSTKTLLVKGGYDSKYEQQTANTTFIQAPGQTTIQAPSGSLTFQMLTIKP